MRGAWTAVRRILVPVAWKTASNEAVKFEPQHGVRVQEIDREDPGGLGVQELPSGRA